MLLFDLWVERFAGRIPRPFPAVPQGREVLPDCLCRDLEAEVGLQHFGQLNGGPQPVFGEFGLEQGFVRRRQSDGASRSRGICNAPQAMLLEAGQVIVNALFCASEMHRQARRRPAFAVQPQKAGPQADFWMNPGPEFQRLKVYSVFGTDDNLAAWSSHFSKV